MYECERVSEEEEKSYVDVEGEDVAMVEEEGDESEEEEGEEVSLSVGKRVWVNGSDTLGSSSALKRYWKSSEFDISSTFASGTLSKFMFVIVVAVEWWWWWRYECCG